MLKHRRRGKKKSSARDAARTGAGAADSGFAKEAGELTVGANEAPADASGELTRARFAVCK